MNDLTTELREVADEGQRATPSAVAEIFASGDRRRRRTLVTRSAAGLTAAAAVAAVAVGVSAAQPAATQTRPSAAANTQATHDAQAAPYTRAAPRRAAPQRVQLTAWTVARQADGDVSVTIRQFADLARLQQTLRADGVPASVLAQGQANHCHVDGTTGLQSVVTGHTASSAVGSASTGVILTIHPSGLLSGDGVQLAPSADFGRPGTTGSLGFRLVQASQACTGS
jgi:hypothetical protein